eukprot:1788060-Rhodomonas_salina.1
MVLWDALYWDRGEEGFLVAQPAYGMTIRQLSTSSVVGAYRRIIRWLGTAHRIGAYRMGA